MQVSNEKTFCLFCRAAMTDINDITSGSHAACLTEVEGFDQTFDVKMMEWNKVFNKLYTWYKNEVCRDYYWSGEQGISKSFQSRNGNYCVQLNNGHKVILMSKKKIVSIRRRTIDVIVPKRFMQTRSYHKVIDTNNVFYWNFIKIDGGSVTIYGYGNVIDDRDKDRFTFEGKFIFDKSFEGKFFKRIT